MIDEMKQAGRAEAGRQKKVKNAEFHKISSRNGQKNFFEIKKCIIRGSHL